MADALAPEERDLRAAELALGLLSGDDRADALRLRLSDPDFANAVNWWEARFAPLLARSSDIAAPDLWPAIEQRLGGLAAAAPMSANDNGSAAGALRQRIAAWRIGALTSGAVAAGLALLLVLRPATQPPVAVPAPSAQAIVAQLGESGSPAQLVANYDIDKAQLRIRAIAIPQSELTPELWVIPAGGAPLSLGLFAADGSSTITVPEALRAALQDGAMLAVSLEKSEGAPHKAPSATPIAVGTLHKI
jgi:anti-sigma-K factor RskA